MHHFKFREISKDPKLLHLAVERVKKSTQLSSIIITIMVIIVSAGTLLIKWSLLRPIHNEIMTKYQNQQPLSVHIIFVIYLMMNNSML
jgi:hypothetical protein